MFKKVDPKVSFPQLEEETLKYWEENKIFEQSVANREGKPKYSFNDGPPFATGLPHYGHIVASVIKDAIPRYWAMRGHQVERKWGWDCHGLPIENIAEKELGIKHKKDIEAMGVAKFNEFCRSKVLEYAAEWEKVIPRIGRWADMKNAYRTMDKEYMESVWWVFKELWDKGLIYESYRSMHVCPRCETTLSQQEVSEGYVDVKDLSVVAKFELVGSDVIPASEPESRDWIPGQARDDKKTYVLAWTTTPWTLPGNVALAVGKDIVYTKSKVAEINGNSTFKLGETYIFAKNRAKIAAHEIFGGKLGETQITTFDKNDGVLCSAVIANDDGSETQIVFDSVDIFGENLLGQSYKPLFDYYAKDTTLPNHENGWKIYAADFVTTEDGTGVVHIAPAFGEDDMELGKKENLPFVQHVHLDGTMKAEVTDFAGQPVKPKEAPQSMDVEIIKYLAHKGLLFSKEKYEHSYPHCWRCDTPLLNYATSSWFVSVTKIKEKMLELAKDIHWSPEHIKEGRFGKWLEGARDWSISRQRYWASVMPIWKCECGEIQVFGSIADLETASGQKVDDLHKHVVDEISVPCTKCGGTMKRVPDVLDTWFDSGSMPYAQEHYPFANEEHFNKSFPADFIAEGVDQTRAWFYYQHVIGTAIKDSVAFKNVIVNGIVQGEDGKKMSKKLKNYPDPMEIVNKHGADALRLYLLSSPIVAAENLNFSERDLTETSRNVFRMLWNSYSFFMTYASIDAWEPKQDVEPSANLLDRWITSELQLLIKNLDQSMEVYELNKAARLFMPFIDNLSNWYIRRSRDRFWKNENDNDKEAAYQTLYDVLVTLSELMAPFTPFLSEEIYRNLTGEASVHLADWPTNNGSIDELLNDLMKDVREIVSIGLQKRAEAKIKVRQPLNQIRLKSDTYKKLLDTVSDPKDKMFLENIILSELNVKGIYFDGSAEENIVLDIELTDDLKLEGEMNEINRAIQDGRKKAGFNVEDRIVLGYMGKENVFQKFGDEIAKKVLATEVKNEDLAEAEYRETITIEGEEFTFSLKRS
ncbi:MAG: isoleucine--tRNA ligase [Candidatus Moranbacteria bacterium]|nr:isoleucine--tRNA ligase [Candidatus Moranbacteria bacterium]MBP6034079.1 isoleucine--tRNA ligase [Candidatus Moranbacteria bacterium]MBP7695831.1 isoleucine--tRNA ligase [Candidatus Moranbacteria bacterium]